MTDRRLHPANARVALDILRGQIDGVDFVSGQAATVTVSVADLCPAPTKTRDRQLLLGAPVTVIEDRDGQSFVQAADGYVGYMPSETLSPRTAPTHRVATLATHAYETESFKSRDRAALPFGAKVTVTNERRKFFETDQGFVPKSHLRELDRPFQDPATVAQLHFGVPYLWGGNSTYGIDCSGLIAASLHACDIDCPADSDMQRADLGVPLNGDPARGDLYFWKGHVAMVIDADTLIHANAHHMACRYEPIKNAIFRIGAQGDGPVTARVRL